MRGVFASLLGLLVAWLGLAAPAAAVAEPPPLACLAYHYDNARICVSCFDTAAERGPPAPYAHGTTYDAVERWSRGASARPGAVTPATTTYGTVPTLVQFATVALTAEGSYGPRAGELRAFRGASVAANTGSRLAEASGSALRAADNVGDFTVSAKHLPGAGGRWNKWAEGVDINGTIASALRSDAATFLPNAGGAADSFIARTNVGSVIGTKGQTYVKAVISNDGRVITAYPVK